MSQVVGLDMVTGMGFIGLEPGRLYKIGQSPKLKDQTASGNPLLLNSAEAPLTALSLYGWSKQDGTPTPENPVPIVSAGSVMKYDSNQLFDAKRVNSLDVGGAAVTNNGDGSFTVSGEGVLSAGLYVNYIDREIIKKLKTSSKAEEGLAILKQLTDDLPERAEQMISYGKGLLESIDRLNDEGQQKVKDYADDLAENPKYRKDTE